MLFRDDNVDPWSSTPGSTLEPVGPFETNAPDLAAPDLTTSVTTPPEGPATPPGPDYQAAAQAVSNALLPAIANALLTPVGLLTREGVLGGIANMLGSARASGALDDSQFDHLVSGAIGFASNIRNDADDASLRAHLTDAVHAHLTARARLTTALGGGGPRPGAAFQGSVGAPQSRGGSSHQNTPHGDAAGGAGPQPPGTADRAKGAIRPSPVLSQRAIPLRDARGAAPASRVSDSPGAAPQGSVDAARPNAPRSPSNMANTKYKTRESDKLSPNIGPKAPIDFAKLGPLTPDEVREFEKKYNTTDLIEFSKRVYKFADFVEKNKGHYDKILARKEYNYIQKVLDYWWDYSKNNAYDLGALRAASSLLYQGANNGGIVNFRRQEDIPLSYMKAAADAISDGGHGPGIGMGRMGRMARVGRTARTGSPRSFSSTGHGGGHGPAAKNQLLDAAMKWGSGIVQQGKSWEDHLSSLLPKGAQLRPGARTWDFHVPKSGPTISAKTIDVTAPTYRINPRIINQKINRYIEDAAKYQQGSETTKRPVPSREIKTRSVQIAVRENPSPLQWSAIRESILHGRRRGTSVIVTPTASSAGADNVKPSGSRSDLPGKTPRLAADLVNRWPAPSPRYADDRRRPERSRDSQPQRPVKPQRSPR